VSYEFGEGLPLVTIRVTSQRRGTQRQKPTPITDRFFC